MNTRTIFKVIELMRVTDEDLERALTEYLNDGWTLSRIDYMRDPGVRRPLMAFVFFEREEQIETRDEP